MLINVKRCLLIRRDGIHVILTTKIIDERYKKMNNCFAYTRARQRKATKQVSPTRYHEILM